MIPVPCETCQLGGSCLRRFMMARETVFAWLEDVPVECEDYQPDFFHGLEGVFA